MAQKDVGHKVPIHTLKTTEEVMDLYDDWSLGDKYNQDMIDWAYSGPDEVVEAFAKHVQDKNISILDAGCGSGLVGEKLSRMGFSKIDGVDISSGLIASISEGIYSNLSLVDLNKPLNFPHSHYDAILCVGTFTYGHVRAKALEEFTRVVKPGGLIGFTINEGVYAKHGFQSLLEEMVLEREIVELELFLSSYLASKDVGAWLGIYRVL